MVALTVAISRRKMRKRRIGHSRGGGRETVDQMSWSNIVASLASIYHSRLSGVKQPITSRDSDLVLAFMIADE